MTLLKSVQIIDSGSKNAYNFWYEVNFDAILCSLKRYLWVEHYDIKTFRKNFENENEKGRRKKSTSGRIAVYLSFFCQWIFNLRTLSLWKNFQKIFTLSKDMAFGVWLIDLKKDCFLLFFDVFLSQSVINFKLYFLIG